MKQKLDRLLQRDLSPRLALALAAALAAAKLLLTSSQLVLITPNTAPLDDTLMYEAAQSITRGQWLGEYGWLTLSKYMFFPVFLAALHQLKIPYLLGCQLLQLAAAAVGAVALAPVVRKNWGRLLAFAALLYNPAASAAYVSLRIYRDSITPALSLLLFAGFIGYALRIQAPLSKGLPFLLAGGVGLACSYLNREDGVWFLPFALCACLATLFFLFWQRAAGRWVKAACLALPWLMLAGGVLAFCLMNGRFYGRAVLSDFTSKEFKDAYGALTRVSQREPQNKVPVPYETRLRIYAAVPEFALLQPTLETDMMYNNYGSVPDREFGAGGFYWALREAAADAGLYRDANTAKEYFSALAAAVNAACDSGLLQAGPPRSGTAPAIKAEHILPTAAEGLANFGRLLVFSEAAPYYKTTLSAQPELRAEYEAFLGSGVNWAARAGSDEPFYSLPRQACYAVLELIWGLFALLTPPCFALALFGQLKAARRLPGWAKGRQAAPLLLWVIQLGLLLAALLRCFIVGFMSVAAFNDVEDIMYLCSAHPILLLYCILGVALLLAPGERQGAE